MITLIDLSRLWQWKAKHETKKKEITSTTIRASKKSQRHT